ncbi:MAG: YbaB/EbfC family nucleoid-associated protein, partial [Clostridiales bacterium]
KAQEELKNLEVEGASGGGMVKVVVNGSQEVLSISIDPQIVDPGDVEMLEDLVLAAIKDGMSAAQDLAAEKMSKVTGGMGNLPGMF